MVLPFVGPEVLAVAAAFICFGRDAGDYERITLADDGLVVERVEGGRLTGWVLDPRKVRVEVEEHGPDEGRRVRVHRTDRGGMPPTRCAAYRAGPRELSQALKSAQGGAA
jgi:uncharacterized membrane protein